jgi:hypothetical protein
VRHRSAQVHLNAIQQIAGPRVYIDVLMGAGGGFGGIVSVPLLSGGQYTQAPELVATGGSGSGLLLSSRINSSGALTSVSVVSAGAGYTAGTGLPQITVDPTYQSSAATLGTPSLMAGINPNGQYPLLSFAPAGVTAAQLNNTYTLLMNDVAHPSPLGVNYLSTRLAQDISAAILAL